MNKKRVYVVKFESKTSDESFIKIGVSSKPVEERFLVDLKNYKVSLLMETKYYDDCDSFIVESNFHSIMLSFKYDPITRLSSGNTECFVNSSECLDSIQKIFDSKYKKSSYIRRFKTKSRKSQKDDLYSKTGINTNFLLQKRYSILTQPSKKNTDDLKSVSYRSKNDTNKRKQWFQRQQTKMLNHLDKRREESKRYTRINDL
jgi:hypothetical protein